jgi:hypothetical protein
MNILSLDRPELARDGLLPMSKLQANRPIAVQPYGACLPRAAVPRHGAREGVTKRISGAVV